MRNKNDRDAARLPQVCQQVDDLGAMDTSSMETGSSASNRCGSSTSALAITTRWR